MTLLDGVQGFADLLRENGVPVSTSEALDAVRAAAAVGVADPARLRTALKATLIKRRGDDWLFHRLFDLHFLSSGRRAGDEEASGGSGDVPGALAEPLEALEAQAEGEIEAEALRAWREGGVRLQAWIERAAGDTDLSGLAGFMQQGRYTQQLLEAAGWGGVQGAAGRLLAAADAAAEAEALRAWIAQRLDRFRDAARARIALEYRRRHLAGEGSPERLLEDRPLHLLSAREVEDMKRVVERLARELRDRIDRRRRIRRRGRLDLHQTLRRSLRYDGVPVEPRFRRRTPRRPDLVLLVDVSDSVRNYARFFLQLAHTLQRVVSRVRTFVFVADLAEATEVFREASVHQAADLAWAGRVVPLFARSDYGWALRTFEREHLAAVTRRTTVFVLGDGRTNYRPPHDDVLARVRRRARRLVWLCPEDRRAWGWGDSEMPAYARHCDRSEVVRNVSDLRRVVAQTLA